MSNNNDRKGRAKDVKGAFFPTPVAPSNMFPEMHGFSPRNLKYMRRFAEVWPDETIVQRCVAQLLDGMIITGLYQSYRRERCQMKR